jgi:hypothetical protein
MSTQIQMTINLIKHVFNSTIMNNFKILIYQNHVQYEYVHIV